MKTYVIHFTMSNKKFRTKVQAENEEEARAKLKVKSGGLAQITKCEEEKFEKTELFKFLKGFRK